MSASIAVHPHRLLPADPATRAIAESLLTLVEHLPILSPHGHVDAAVLERDERFPDPATMLVTPDHYVTRLLHAAGVPLGELGLGSEPAPPREVWRRFCAGWPLFDGTASGYWLRSELVQVFGIDDARLTAEHADDLYDELERRLGSPEFRPRALFERFGIEVFATTDDPLDDLSAHRALAADPTFRGRVLPTFRPDAYLKAHSAGWAERVDRLISVAAGGASGYAGYIAALEERRRYFIAHGAVSTDHGAATAQTLKLDPADAAALFDRARAGDADAADAAAFEAHMMYEMARMSVDDGLVMTVHPGVFRNHHRPSFDRFGGDTGHDIPVRIDYTAALRPLLNDFGTREGFHLVLFTIDETTFSRELAPLAGFYPAVYIGAPWWFLDAPDAMLRFRSAVTETAGFSRASGFIDDTRAFASIPARHDAARRVECAFLARLVAEHRITEERAAEIVVDLVDHAPRRVFKL
ncbi:glucuronate isomerase [Diaminobutyricimonas aerilata]|nr:glucuronate isomerase [Diaminobutyricimonas aerilata]